MSKIDKPGLLIFYDHFYPAYKAGGPIQSLTNLIVSLQDEYIISVITSGYDLNEDHLLANIQTDTWSKVLLADSTSTIQVWYAGSGKPGLASMKDIIEEADPSIIYLNGIFSYTYVLLPLLAARNRKVVICPRGMLQKGALAGKALKKKIYLLVFRLSGLCKRIIWHATNEEEQEDIKRIFGGVSKIFIAGNIPKKPLEKISNVYKSAGQLRLVYLSLITAKKNLLQLIEILSTSRENISLDIYGPVKDGEYWKKCQHAIKSSASKINYKGDVLPSFVQETFEKYDASILLTRGENFGHALYESLSVGRPVITSYFTIWNQLEEKKAGWNVDISNEKNIIEIIEQICNMDNPTFEGYCIGAHNLAKQYYLSGFDVHSYRKIFSC